MAGSVDVRTENQPAETTRSETRRDETKRNEAKQSKAGRRRSRRNGLPMSDTLARLARVNADRVSCVDAYS
ncbi:hypothetical protein A8H35_28200 [Burkholderia thailandensis]|nr:hypothetical protein A8H35_28200 [Burkholderia thailandensis]AWY63961.1 hypothetical protein A8H36_00400 [Burkholderia thailandensis]PNE71684.1 hypothetical protein A8H38_05800 [Burkholderia thailandensis]